PLDFRTEADALIAGGMDFPDRIAEQHRSFDSHTVLNWFLDSRHELLDALTSEEPRRRVPWFGPDMSVASCATARLMETWAHGRDVYDALGVQPPPSPGLRSIAHLGVSTFAFSHKLHGLDVPEDAVFVDLNSPAGESWTWGPSDALNRVHGPVEDFVLTVTQRRHWTETALIAEGPVAQRWLDVAQAFAGAPTRKAVPR
ncbi:MAG: TIGR03084 family metal-binding protein, partial [Mycobacterium sp.]